jgi:hypothetical protein
MKKSTGIICLILSIAVIVGLGYIAMFGIGAGKTGSAAKRPSTHREWNRYEKEIHFVELS